MIPGFRQQIQISRRLLLRSNQRRPPLIADRRNIQEVLASQKKMLARRNEPDETPAERMTELFQDDLWRATYLLKRKPQFEVLELDYTAMVAQPLGEVRRINEFLGGRLNVEAMAAVADPQLYRNRAPNA